MSTTLKPDIDRMRTNRAALVALRDDQRAQIDQMRAAVAATGQEIEKVDAALEALERAEEILRESLPPVEPEPVPDFIPEPEPAPVAPKPEPTQTPTAREVEESIKARREIERRTKAGGSKAAKKKRAKAAKRYVPTDDKPKPTNTPRYSRDPLTVRTRDMTNRGPDKKPRAKGHPWHTGILPAGEQITPTDRERGELILQLLQESDTDITVSGMVREVQDLLSIEKTATAQAVTARVLRVLANLRLVTTDEQIKDEITGRRSDVVRLTTPQERASAGLPDDDEANPKTRLRPLLDKDAQVC